MSTDAVFQTTNTVLPIEDQTASCEMLAMRIGAMDGLRVAGQATSKAEALELADRYQPTMVVRDWMMAGFIYGVQLVAKGILERLEISIRTVHSHLSALIRKSGLRSSDELTLFASEQGLLPSPSFAL